MQNLLDCDPQDHQLQTMMLRKLTYRTFQQYSLATLAASQDAPQSEIQSDALQVLTRWFQDLHKHRQCHAVPRHVIQITLAEVLGQLRHVSQPSIFQIQSYDS